MPSLQYVVLRHEGIADPHFDLMFESAPGSLLSTWRSPAWPITAVTPLVRLDDHRRDFLNYEGALSRNRGYVRRAARGTCDVIVEGDGAWHITLDDETPQNVLIARNEEGWVAKLRESNLRA